VNFLLAPPNITEATLLRAADAFQHATQWRKHRPACANP
jgi:hypothetical protein